MLTKYFNSNQLFCKHFFLSVASQQYYSLQTIQISQSTLAAPVAASSSQQWTPDLQQHGKFANGQSTSSRMLRTLSAVSQEDYKQTRNIDRIMSIQLLYYMSGNFTSSVVVFSSCPFAVDRRSSSTDRSHDCRAPSSNRLTFSRLQTLSLSLVYHRCSYLLFLLLPIQLWTGAPVCCWEFAFAFLCTLGALSLSLSSSLHILRALLLHLKLQGLSSAPMHLRLNLWEVGPICTIGLRLKAPLHLRLGLRDLGPLCTRNLDLGSFYTRD